MKRSIECPSLTVTNLPASRKPSRDYGPAIYMRLGDDREVILRLVNFVHRDAEEVDRERTCSNKWPGQEDAWPRSWSQTPALDNRTRGIGFSSQDSCACCPRLPRQRDYKKLWNSFVFSTLRSYVFTISNVSLLLRLK